MNKIKSRESIILIFIFSFIICDFFRRAFICNILKVDSNLLGYMNYFVYIFLLLTIIIKLKYKMYDYKILYCFIFIQILFFINFKVNSYELKRYFYQQVFVILPILLIGIKFNRKDFNEIYSLIIKSLNILITVIVFLGIIDFITRSGVQKLLASNNYFESLLNVDILNQTGVYRYFSFYGHPLRIAQIIIIFYILNAINYEYFENDTNMLFVSIISIIGIMLTSSKAGIIIILALILINGNIYKKMTQKISFNIGILGIIIIIVTSEFFKEVVLARLIGIDFSSGRNDVFKFIELGYLPKPTFIGNGVDYTGYLLSTIKTGISSFEYPFLILAYECGMIITSLLYYCFISPIIKFITKKQLKLIIYFVAITGIVNIYNGITVMGDYMIQYCFIIMIFRSISYYLEDLNEEKDIICNR